MQIGDSNNISGVRKSTGITPNQYRPLRGPAGQTFAADQIQLSILGAHLSAAQGNSAVQLEKLSHLTAAVGSGAYRVDAQQVSASIIADHLT
ncbi:MAG TPA: flagellar biosynthesis anti-sigma factor FlgM [Bryobacteraceae bacterium]